MAKKRQPGTQEEDHNDGQEEATKNTTMAMAMARKSATKNPKPQRWPKNMQLGTEEDNHGDGQEERNHEHKRTTITNAERSIIVATLL
jgi:hypothetical protein